MSRGIGIATGFPDFSDDLPVLEVLGIGLSDLIGYGGEARVYGLDADRIARILHPDSDRSVADTQRALIETIHTASTGLDFDTQEIFDLEVICGRIVIVEKRFGGDSLASLLETAGGEARTGLIVAMLDTAEQIYRIDLKPKEFGDLAHQAPLNAAAYQDYMIARTRANLAHAAAGFAHISATELVRALPVPTQMSLVHIDLFPGNVLIDSGKVSAVIDFGSAIIGDRRMDIWSAVAYLDAQISPHATDEDRAVAQGWLVAQGLDKDYRAARNWLAAYWAFAHDDPNVLAWSSSVLLD